MLILWGTGWLQAGVHPDLVLSVVAKPPGVEITARAPDGQSFRVETSDDLDRWLPIAVATPPPSTLSLTDAEFRSAGARFYRARLVEAAVEIVPGAPLRAQVGSAFDLYGQFFAPNPGDNLVLVGGRPATVVEATETRLRVQLPPDAVSGDLVVITPRGTARSRAPFTVTQSLPVEWDLPPGVSPESWEVVSAYGPGTAQPDGTLRVEVRVGRPQILFALPHDPAHGVFYAAVSPGSSSAVRFSAATTAEALLFLHPLFHTQDPDAAVRRLAQMRAEGEVAALGTIIASLWPRDTDPFAESALINAYRAAVLSSARALARATSPDHPRARLHAAAPAALPWELDLDFIRLTNGLAMSAARGDALSLGLDSIEWNPVDWLVVAREVDADAALPRGEEDLRKIYQNGYTLGLDPKTIPGYPLREGFVQTRKVSAQLAFRNFHIIDELVDRADDFLFGPDKPEPFQFPDQDAVYLVRAVGPGLATFAGSEADQEQAFLVTNHEGLHETYRRAVALNLLTAALDLLSGSLDLADEMGQLETSVVQEGLRDLSFQAATDALMWKAPKDVLATVLDLAKESTKFIATKAAEKGLESLARKAGGALGKAAGLASAILEGLDVAGSFGEAYERGLGFFSTTPLESALVVVGNPFRLEIVGLDPPGGAPGDRVDVVIRKAQFDLNQDGDRVFVTSTNGAAPFFARTEVIEATPPADGQQQIQVRLPTALRDQPSGSYLLHVRAQGRSGEREFTLVEQPVIERVDPLEGFAAVDNFLGQPFDGSSVRVRGLGFGPEDDWFFGEVPANSKSGKSGDVVVRVPRGAATGTVRVRRSLPQAGIREAVGPRFTVLGPPVILAASPASGPPGTILGLTVAGLGTKDAVSATYAVLQLPGGVRPGLAQLGNNLRTIIPVLGEGGPLEIELHTPAGSTKTTFQVTEGRARGAELIVGQILGCTGPTNSPLSLAAALEISAASEGGARRLPNDDLDLRRDPANGGVIEELDLNCAWEEGDFVSPDLGPYDPPESGTIRTNMAFRWPVGTEYADRILVTEETDTIAGELTFAGSYDSLHVAKLLGSMRVVGTNNLLTVGSFKGTRLVIEGSHNQVSGAFELDEGVVILGDQNTLSGSVSKSKADGIVVRGDFNEINVTVLENERDGLVIDGGQFNHVIVAASRNRRNGVALMGGASANQVSVATGIPFGTGMQRGTGNGGHGILLTGGAHDNQVFGVGPIGANTGDGVRLDGEDLDYNQLRILDAVDNDGHGFYLGSGALGTVLDPIIARNNGGDGIHLAGARETSAGLIRSGFNSGNGVTLIGVNDSFTTFAALELRDNAQAGLLLSGTTRGLEFDGTIESGTVGVRVVGSGVAENRLRLDIRGCRGNGAEVTESTRNRFWLDVRDCGGHGVLARSASTNEFDLHAENNQGDGLRLIQASHGNDIMGTYARNESGVVVADGSQRNTLHALQAKANRVHGLHLTGTGTRGNTVFSVAVGDVWDSPSGNAGDGIRIDEGASGNAIGLPGEVFVSGSGGAGIRVAGSTTEGNRVAGVTISSPDNGPRQPAAIVVEDHAPDTVIGGPREEEHNHLNGNLDGIVLRTGARGTAINNGEIQNHTGAGIRVTDAPDNLIGGAGGPGVQPVVPAPDGGVAPALTWGNLVTDNELGLEISGATSVNVAVRGNTFLGNGTGMLLSGAVQARIVANWVGESRSQGIELDGAADTRIADNDIADNTAAGVRMIGATTGSDLAGNRIRGNATGLEIVGAAARRNRLRANAIWANNGQGIRLVSRANDGRAAPQIESFSSQSVIGTSDAPDGSAVEVFTDPVTDFDEGRTTIGWGRVQQGRFNVRLDDPLHPAEVGVLFGLNATVTDADANTSEFGTLAGGTGGVTSLVFASTREGNAELYLSQGLYSPPLRLTQDPGTDTDPALSPDGTQVAFVSTRFGDPELCLLTLTGTNPVVRLTTHPATDAAPSWSSDGKKFAFVSERDGNPEIHAMNVDGTGLIRLTDDGGADASPAWSPDGQKLVFASDRSGNWDLWTMNADGSNADALLPHPADDRQPSWSPDGVHVAFASTRDGNDEVYVLELATGGLTRVTDHPGSDHSPAWLDGDWLVFVSDRDEGFELYRVSRSGGPPERLTLSSGDNLDPHAGH